MIDELNRVAALKAELNKLRPLDAEAEKRIMQKFRLDWNYHSNHLEGTQLTYGETKALILFGITAQGKPLKDHLEITGHNEAIDFVTKVVKDEYPLTETFIRQLHTLLLKESYMVDAVTPDGQPTKRRVEIGKYKTQPNHVLTQTGETFYFATPEETPAKMMDLIEWYRQKKAETDVNSVVLAAEFHYKFIRIHPFDDGNGRLARILMNFILMQFGYPPVIIKTEDKNNYFSVLQQADAGILEPFIEYIAANLQRSLEIMIKGAKGESIEDPDDLDKELALLEQRLKRVGSQYELVRSKEVLWDLFDRSINPLLHEFFTGENKFDRFYDKKSYVIQVDSSVTTLAADPNNDYSSLKNRFQSDTTSVSILYVHQGFNVPGFSAFDLGSKITLKFNTATYSVDVHQLISKFHIEKSYSESLTEDEIREAIKKLSEEHKNYIETEIKKNESANEI